MAVQHTAKLSGKLGNNFNLFEDIQCGAITNRNTVQVLLGLKKKNNRKPNRQEIRCDSTELTCLQVQGSSGCSAFTENIQHLFPGKNASI